MVALQTNEVKLLKSETILKQFSILLNSNKSSAKFTSDGLEMTFLIPSKDVKNVMTIMINLLDDNNGLRSGFKICIGCENYELKNGIPTVIFLPFSYILKTYFNENSTVEFLNPHTIAIKPKMKSSIPENEEEVEPGVRERLIAILEKNGIKMDCRKMYILSKKIKEKSSTYRCLLIQEGTEKEEIKNITICSDGIALLF